MHVEFQLEAQLRREAGMSRLSLELADSSTLLAALRALATHVSAPAAAHLLKESAAVRPGLLILVNDNPVAVDEVHQYELSPGDVIFLMPPIAGG